MTDEFKEKLLQLAYTNRYYINTSWQDKRDQPDAHDVATAMIDILTGKAAPSPTGIGELTQVDTPEIIPLEDYSPPDWKFGTSYFPVVGHRFSPSEFMQYLKSSDLALMKWNPTGVTIHHTASPNLSQRPNGFEPKHMGYLREYYKDSLGWSRGPHLFVDDEGIWVFSPLNDRGIHARSFNADRIGIEMLGEYSYEDNPHTGRGKKVLDMSKFAAAALMKQLNISTGRLNFHRDDPKTSKDCPGKKISFEPFEADVIAIHDKL